jgi:hypothetical protein
MFGKTKRKIHHEDTKDTKKSTVETLDCAWQNPVASALLAACRTPADAACIKRRSGTRPDSLLPFFVFFVPSWWIF